MKEMGKFKIREKKGTKRTYRKERVWLKGENLGSGEKAERRDWESRESMDGWMDGCKREGGSCE